MKMKDNNVKVDLYNRSFLTLLDFSQADIRYLLDLSHQLKRDRNKNIRGNSLNGKNIALLFEKNSTRTRLAFEVAIAEEGGYASFIDVSNSHFGKKESVADSAKVLARYYDAIEFRGYSQQFVIDLAKYSGIPVYNGLTDDDHPTQILADLMTIEEKIKHKPLSEVKVVYVGDTRNNMANAWMYGCAKMGMHFVAYGPKSLHPDSAVVENARKIATESGAVIEVTDDETNLAGADVIYTDVWVSMGEEAEIANRARLLKDYQITMDMLRKSNNPQVIFMHCLPAFHEQENKFVKQAYEQFGVDICEVTDEVFQSCHSVVFDEAENRLHTIKAVLVATLGNDSNKT